VIPAQPPKFGAFQIQNENKLLKQYRGAIGGKTGFTDLARHTYVGAAQRNGRRLVVALLRGEQRPQRLWQQGAALLDWGFTVPAGAEPVGRLVTPEDLVEQSPPPPAPAAALTGTRAASEPRRSPGSTIAVAGGVAAALLLVSVVALRLRAVRRRRLPGRRRARGAPVWPDGS
jgi:D-alanyl-D-alanine carboxypeptidase (penicillin-binding protein 5/6)